MCLLPKRSLDRQIYMRGERTHSFPVVCFIGSWPSIQTPLAALSHDDSLATEDFGTIPLPGNTSWRHADPPVRDAEPHQHQGFYCQPCPGLRRTDPGLERAPMPSLQWAPIINQAQRCSHPRALLLPHPPGRKARKKTT